MEPRFGSDFSRVRVHSDPATLALVKEQQAAAISSGSDIAFAEGRYEPRTDRGLRLLAHELAHVAQYQQAGPGARRTSEPSDPAEHEAHRAAAALGWGGLTDAYPSLTTAVETEAGGRSRPALPMLTRAPAAFSRVQLTYDDGPDTAGNTRHVLDALNAAGARATFYLVGKRVAQGDNWRIVFDMAASGQLLGNHAFDWNDATDDHIFLHGTVEERAEKILMTEWAIRDALTTGRDDAKKRKAWDSVPAANQAYIEDVIAHGTGRFRTPGFKSHVWTTDGAHTAAAITSVNQVLAATGLRPLAITEVGLLTHEGVSVDPHDYEKGKTKEQITSTVTSGVSANDASILLHSRIAATAEATPAVLADIKGKKFSFDPTVQGALGQVQPKPGFAGLAAISDPPTSAQVSTARAFLRDRMEVIGPYLSGNVAIGIFQLAQRAGPKEVDDFTAWVRTTSVKTPDGPVPLANWMNANPEWREFASFYENWRTGKPFPRIPGVTQLSRLGTQLIVRSPLTSRIMITLSAFPWKMLVTLWSD